MVGDPCVRTIVDNCIRDVIDGEIVNGSTDVTVCIVCVGLIVAGSVVVVIGITLIVLDSFLKPKHASPFCLLFMTERKDYINILICKYCGLTYQNHFYNSLVEYLHNLNHQMLHYILRFLVESVDCRVGNIDSIQCSWFDKLPPVTYCHHNFQ